MGLRYHWHKFKLIHAEGIKLGKADRVWHTLDLPNPPPPGPIHSIPALLPPYPIPPALNFIPWPSSLLLSCLERLWPSHWCYGMCYSAYVTLSSEKHVFQWHHNSLGFGHRFSFFSMSMEKIIFDLMRYSCLKDMPFYYT